MDEWLDRLLEHDAAYAEMAAVCEKTPIAWYLSAPSLPDFPDANRALRLRDDGRGAEAVAHEVISHFQMRGMQPIVDIDPIAEQQGIGYAVRRLGLMPVLGDRILMRSTSVIPVARSIPEISIQIVPNESGSGEAADWIETAISDDLGQPDEALWRAVASREARYTSCKLYLALLDGQPAGTCDVFSYKGWARIDSVVTRAEFRRRGVASALVSQAAADSVTIGSSLTYLFTEANSEAEGLYAKLGFERWYRNPLRRHQV